MGKTENKKEKKITNTQTKEVRISIEQKITKNILLFLFERDKLAFDFCSWDTEYLYFMSK